MDKKTLQTLIDDARLKREPGGVIVVVDETHYQINDHPYELVANYRDGFDRSELSDRFNTYFSRYDYLVGDWGFGQLRLRGFYADSRNVAGELKISALQDYLDEACNTGCPYFVMHNEDVKVAVPKKSGRQREGGRNHSRHQAHGQSQSKTHQVKSQPQTGNRSNHSQSTNHQPAKETSTGSHPKRRRQANKQKAYTVEKVKPVKPTPLSQRKGTVKTVGHSQHRKFTIREKKD